MKPKDLKLGQIVSVPLKHGYRLARVTRIVLQPSVTVEFDDPQIPKQDFAIEEVGECGPVEEAAFWKECAFKLREKIR